ncbi:hypothetical protein BKE38_12540 [Pseudoroseomonas deserti]|uniref:Uncharacterized protein n=1 Tax=Teichococcus deserti TaxID=1817963 RepID=A0A1V2H374_9PROT|nr:hypothetical protein [Pseudoroseomonas deserti]ONG53283.1 hypothetical protein BKE38_12540 [Pseudoroseomonas deserti]
MSRKTARPSAEPKPKSIQTKEALKRLADLASKPVAPDRIRREVEGMVKIWLDGAGDERRIELRDKLEEMGGELGEGVEAATEALGDLDNEDLAGKRHATAALHALRAAKDALVQARTSL